LFGNKGKVFNDYVKQIKDKLIEEFGDDVYKYNIIMKDEETGDIIEYVLPDEIVDFKN